VLEERRSFDRLNLTKPIDGTFGEHAVMVVEVSVGGAKIVHDEPMKKGATALLRFEWRGQKLAVLSQVTRSDGARSGLHFLEHNEVLAGLVNEWANEVLTAQQANADGNREANVIGEGTLTSASAGARALAGFLQYHLTPNGWKCHRALLPDQPEDGFTVSANESQEQIDLLCRTYEAGDAEAKKMTRMIAGLSISR
jgi:PilZ domain-containing protein